jgi:hypothetical protein
MMSFGTKMVTSPTEMVEKKRHYGERIDYESG